MSASASANDVGIEVAKAVPPTAVATWHFFGHVLPEWVSLLTVVYLACVLAQMGYRFVAWVRRRPEPARESARVEPDRPWPRR